MHNLGLRQRVQLRKGTRLKPIGVLPSVPIVPQRLGFNLNNRNQLWPGL